MQKEVLMTESGLKKYEAELEELKSVRRKEISEKIKVALSFGDLSENSEYDEAKNEQAIVEMCIRDRPYPAFRLNSHYFSPSLEKEAR